MTIKLNKMESAVLVAIANNMLNNGGDFGFTDEIDYAALGLTARQYSGYVSQLVQKGIIWVENPVVNFRVVKGQCGFIGTADICELVREIGIDPMKYDEFYADGISLVDGTEV